MQRRSTRPPSAAAAATDDGESEDSSGSSSDDDAGAGNDSRSSHSKQQRHSSLSSRSAHHDRPAADDSTAGVATPLNNDQSPGPAAYSLPSCFKPRTPRNAASYLLASNIAASVKGRSWPAGTGPLAGGISPGPQAYSPRTAAVRRSAGRAVFGSAHRSQEDKRYLGSEQLNKAAGRGGTDGPGPACYRVGCGRQPGRAAPGPCSAPRAAFAPPRTAPSSPALAGLRRVLSCSLHATSRPGSQQQQQHPLRLPAHLLAAFHSCSSSPRQDTATRAAEATWGSSSSTSSGSQTATASGGRAQQGSSQKSVQNAGRKWSFGPAGGPERGLERRRSQESNVFISPAHAAVDRGRAATAAGGPGPSYDVDGKLGLLSTHRVAGAAAISKEKKAAEFKAKLYLSSEHVKADPSLTDSPGPGTANWQLPGCLGAAAASTGPRFGSPPRQHDIVNRGNDSPGPACYDAAAAAAGGSVLGDRRTAHFGTGERAVSGAVVRTFAPGPGAYKTDLLKLSTHTCPPSYSLGALLPAAWATSKADSPGPAAYRIDLADAQCLPADSAAVSIKGKLEQGGTTSCNCSPGPQTYSPRLGMGYEAQHAWQQRWHGSKHCSGSGESRLGSPASRHSSPGAARSGSPAQTGCSGGGAGGGVVPPLSSMPGTACSSSAERGCHSSSSGGGGQEAKSGSFLSDRSCRKCMRWGLGCSSTPGGRAVGNDSCSSSSGDRGGLFIRTTGTVASTAAFGQAGEAADAPAAAVGRQSGSPQRQRGFSIQGKDNRPAGSGIRSGSPGPAAYQVNEAAVARCGGTLKFSSRSTASSPRQA